MNIDDLIREREVELQQIKELKELDLGEVNAYGNGTLFMAELRTFEDVKLALRRLPKPQKLTSYYTSSYGGLCLGYDICEWQFNYYISEDIEKALAIVSSGKCKLETVIKTEESEEVVCAINNN